MIRKNMFLIVGFITRTLVNLTKIIICWVLRNFSVSNFTSEPQKTLLIYVWYPLFNLPTLDWTIVISWCTHCFISMLSISDHTIHVKFNLYNHPIPSWNLGFRIAGLFRGNKVLGSNILMYQTLTIITN